MPDIVEIVSTHRVGQCTAVATDARSVGRSVSPAQSDLPGIFSPPIETETERERGGHTRFHAIAVDQEFDPL